MFVTTIVIVAMPTDVSQLASALNHADAAERSKAAEQLARLGPDAQPAAAALTRACGDPKEEVRQWAAAALEEMGAPSPADVDTLAALVADKSPDVGYWAATLLGRLAAEAAPAVGALASAVLSDLPAAVRQRSAWALGKIGPPAAASLDALRQVASDVDPRLARLARRAIDQIGG